MVTNGRKLKKFVAKNERTRETTLTTGQRTETENRCAQTPQESSVSAGRRRLDENETRWTETRANHTHSARCPSHPLHSFTILRTH